MLRWRECCQGGGRRETAERSEWKIAFSHRLCQVIVPRRPSQRAGGVDNFLPSPPSPSPSISNDAPDDCSGLSLHTLRPSLPVPPEHPHSLLPPSHPLKPCSLAQSSQLSLLSPSSPRVRPPTSWQH